MIYDLITFETARLAQEKGFDVPCLHYWSIHHAGIKRPVLAPSFSGRNQNFNGYDFTKESYSAPTQSLLQRWLREEHKIDIIVTRSDEVCRTYLYYVEIRDYRSEEYIETAIVHLWKSNVYKFNIGARYKTHEEALEKGLEESLKLI